LLGATIVALNPLRVTALKRTATAIARLLPLCLDQASQDEMTLVTQELLLIDGGLEPQMLEELDHVSLVD